MSKEGLIDFVRNLKAICAVVDLYGIPGPLSTEILVQVPGSEDVSRMVDDGQALTSIDKRIVSVHGRRSGATSIRNSGGAVS